MKYRLVTTRRAIRKKRKGLIRAKRIARAVCVYSPLPRQSENVERIRLDELFEISALPEPARPSALRRAAGRARAFFAGIFRGASTFFKKVLLRKRPPRLAFYSGVACAALCVAVLSALTVLLSLFGRFLMPYKSVTVPSLVGQTLDDAQSNISNEFLLEISYKNSDSVKEGTVMAQSPSPSVMRRYYKNGEPCVIELTVSAGKHYYTVEQLSDMSERDALLKLRNAGVAVSVKYEYSSEVSAGTVISTSPAPSQRLYDGQTLTLKVSLGKEMITVSVPDLYGLGEAQAKAALEARGLTLGNITYQTSDRPAGSVIAQQYSPYSRIERGASVNITVSLGISYAPKSVPDLYGLTLEQAEQRLADFGLVLGQIYQVTSGAPKGTVVSQTPIPQTPITSSVTSIDVFISS